MSRFRPEGYHPDLVRAARLLPKEIFRPSTLPLMRRAAGLAGRRSSPEVVPVRVGAHAHLRLHLPPDGAPGPGSASGVMLWIHGGGYVMGSAAQDDALCRRFAAKLGVVVAAVDYRLAPEHPYPAALQDCYAALRWLSRSPGVDPARIVIAGASAGGGLAAALALLARDRGEIEPLFQLLVYPMVEAPGPLPHSDDDRYRLFTHRTNRWSWERYLRGVSASASRSAVPAWQDLTGTAPAWIGVGTLDPLHDEGLRYHAALTDAGVRCELDIVDGAFHGFDAVVPGAAVSRAFFQAQVTAVSQALGIPEPISSSPSRT